MSFGLCSGHSADEEDEEPSYNPIVDDEATNDDAFAAAGRAPLSAIRLVDRATGRRFATASGADILAASRTRTWWQSPLVFEVHRMSSHAYLEHTTDGTNSCTTSVAQ